MASLFARYRSNTNGGLSKDKKKEKEEPPVELTPLEKMLQNVGPVKPHDTAKFFGLENFGNTCYCNSIVQALFYSEVFRDLVVNYPQPLSDSTPKLDITIRPPSITALPPVTKKNALPLNPTGIGLRPEDRPDAPEYKKRQAMLKGPILELIKENLATAEMEECTFTGLKDIFLTLLQSQSRTGVLSPQRFLELFKRENEMFRNSMHQDAHEFYGLVLNDIISNLEAHERATIDSKVSITALSSPETSLVRDIFEGLLSSETKCLTCETVSKKDETFLDLSIDLEEHSSVTSCLSKFSEEEVLCERNKFQCDRCGGLQEAEKRMKIERLPKILALHLKRFKYTEDFTRLQKLQHRVAYPSHLRLFNTTPNTQDPDRVYELYAVVVHIGGNVYHGHYVSVIKTTDHGWLLFDDEMVEPVDDNYVNNFFGEPNGLATAYVLFYRETTYEDAKALDEDISFCGSVASSDAAVEVEADAEAPSTPNGHSMTRTAHNSEPTPGITFSQTLPNVLNSIESGGSSSHPTSSSATHPPPVIEDKKAEKKRLKEGKKAEKQEAKEEKERRKHEHDNADDKHRKTSNNNLGTIFLERANWSGKSMSRRSLAFLTSKKKDERNGSGNHDGENSNNGINGYPAPPSTSGTTSTTATNEVNGASAHIPSSVSESDGAASTPVVISSPITMPIANGVTNGNAVGQSPPQAPGAPEGPSNNSQGQVGDSSQSPPQYPEQKKDKDKEKDGKEGKKSWFGFGLGKKKSTSAFS